MSDNVPKGYKSYRDEFKTIDELPEEYQDGVKKKHIILFTTEPQPELATSPFERLTECMFTLATHNIIQATPGYPACLIQPKSCAYRIAPSPGAGLGMFATRPLAEGDLIMSERAIIIVPAVLDAAQPDMHDIGLSDDEQRAVTTYSVEEQLGFIFERLLPIEQANYMALANNFSDCGPLWGRLQTNGFNLRNLNSASMDSLQGACAGVFDKVSRINHSCGPNTHRRFHIPSLSMRIYAVRDIAEGEELTLTYNGEWETPARQKSAQKYGFQCRCPSCLDAEASDRRRKRIAREYSESAVNQWIQIMAEVATGLQRMSVLPGILRYAEEGIHLIEIEGLQAHHCYRHVLMCMLCVLAAIGTDEERFRKYGLLLLKRWIAEGWNLGRRFEMFQKNIRDCSRLRYHTGL